MTKRNKKNKKNKPIILGGGTINNTASTYSKGTGFTKYTCHNGNTLIYTEPQGGSLYIGGWGNGATYDWNTHVIDLTGLEHKWADIAIAFDEVSKDFLPFVGKSYAGWLSLPFPDYGTPASMRTKEQWQGMTEVIKNILRSGKDVLVACQGGHGRSGLFVSIVGYMLNIKNDPAWASPVEHLRKIHCQDAVETFAQEKFVYDILGLKIQSKHAYDNDMYWYGRDIPTQTYQTRFKKCPICGTESVYIDEFGMCMTCEKQYEKVAPIREDLTLKDIEHQGEIPHSCTEEKCMGIWKASKCGHTVHNQIIYEGLCETCYRIQEDAENMITEGKTEHQDACALCGKGGVSAEKFGICFDCSSKLVQGGFVTDVHNSITDPYKFITHTYCEDELMCVGIIRADVCQHVVHNREIEDGCCPDCHEMKYGKTEVQ